MTLMRPHSVPARQATNKPNAIVFKCVRRLIEERVMSFWREAFNLQPEDLGFFNLTQTKPVKSGFMNISSQEFKIFSIKPLTRRKFVWLYKYSLYNYTNFSGQKMVSFFSGKDWDFTKITVCGSSSHIGAWATFLWWQPRWLWLYELSTLPLFLFLWDNFDFLNWLMVY